MDLSGESNANHDIRVRNSWQVEFKLESLESRTGIQLFVVQLQVTVSDLCKRPTKLRLIHETVFVVLHIRALCIPFKAQDLLLTCCG